MNRPEQALHKSVAQYLQLLENQGKLTYFSVPNGEKRNAITGALLKAMGTRAGAPDFIVLRKGFHFAVELKAAKGRVSKSQADFKERWENHGGNYMIARSLKEIMERF